MKKIFTSLVLLGLGCMAMAQYEMIPTPISVKTKDGGIRSDIPWVGVVDFKNDIINETFDTWPPTDWEIVDGSESQGLQHWHQDGTDNMYASVQYDDGDGVARNQDEWLITPSITIEENTFLTFQFHSNPYWMVDPNNNADVIVQISSDGTTWTEIWNEDDFEFEYDVWTEVYLSLGDYVAQDIQIAFQYVGTDACWFYIDDVRVYAIPEFDLEITDARISFFEILDYHADASDFHYSSHYQKIPFEILDGNETAYLAFNAMVINKGYGDATVQCNVVINDPDDIEIYNGTSLNTNVIGEMGVDTVDVAYIEGSEFLLDNPKIGMYEVIYTVYEGNHQGVTIEKSKELLTKTVTFEVTDKEYSRASENIDNFVGPKTWVGGGTEGDILTVKYLFFENTVIDNVQAYIHEDTDPGTSLICNIYQYDSGTSEYVAVATSTLITLESSDIGTWKTFTFSDPGFITHDDEYSATPALIGFEFYYNGVDNNLWLGCDETVRSSPWGTLWYMYSGTNSNVWTAITNFIGVPMIKMMLHDEEGAVESNAFAESISVYPNPTTDFCRLTGVKDCKVELFNDIGKRLQQFVSSSEEFDIDCSCYSSGTYFVRIIDESNNTQAIKRISIIK